MTTARLQSPADFFVIDVLALKRRRVFFRSSKLLKFPYLARYSTMASPVGMGISRAAESSCAVALLTLTLGPLFLVFSF
jgi:hypothetical protein